MKFVRVYIRSLNILFSEERRLTITLLFTCALVGIVQAYEPVLFGRVIDSLSQGQHSHVLTLLFTWAGIGLTNVFMSVFLAVTSDRFSHRQRLNTLDHVFERVISLPHSYHSSQGSGKVIHAILSGTDQLFQLWLSFLREHLASLIGIAFLIPLAIKMNWQMATLLFLLSIVYLIANFLVVKKTTLRQQQIQGYHENLSSRIGDVIGNVTVVQSYTRLWQEVQGLQQLTAQLLSAQYPVLTWWGILSVITRVSATITMVAILGLGSWLVAHNQITVGEVVSFVSFSALLIGKLEQISGFVSRLIAQAPSLQNFFQLLDLEDGAQELPNAQPIENVRGLVEFKDVSFHHKSSTVGVFNLNFKVDIGQTVALVGPSGSGKTTTLALMQRLFDPQQGSIEIDGQDVKSFTLASLRHSIATVFQDAGLFNRSVAENIRVGRPGATDAEMIAAAVAADAHEFIMKKPGGYEFIIGERGAALSGGERQRIAIARAILKNAPILIFDEATSALDNQTEKRIQQAISNLRTQNKTTFIIAHRLSTVISADLILVFESGRIVQAGTFEKLKNQNGLFATLVKMGELQPEHNAPKASDDGGSFETR